MKTRTTLKKQKILIIVLSVLAVVTAVMCLLFPVIFKEELNTVYAKTSYGDDAQVMIYDKTAGRSLLGDIAAIRQDGAKNTLDVKEGDGKDILYTFRKNDVEISYRPYIFPEIPLSDLDMVTVTNEHGSFSIFSDNKANFFIKGAEANLYNQQFVSELLLQARYMLADTYVEKPQKASDYGLTEEDCLAKVEVLSKNGEKHTVYVGNREIGGTRYYMKHADKKQIYVMDSGAENFLNDVRYYLSPEIVRPLGEQQGNYLSDFSLTKNSELFFSCEIIPDEERVGVLKNQLHRMTYPAKNFVLSTDTLYDMFQKAVSLSGAGVLEYGVSKKENADEILSEHGLLQPAYEIRFSFDGERYNISVGNKEQTDSGVYYYVYSEYQDTIVPVAESSLNFLEYDIVELFQENVFQYNIDDIAQIELRYGEKTVNYVVSGERDSLSVKESTGNKTIDVPSFRQFYISLLNVTIAGYSSIEGTVEDTHKHDLTFIVTLDSGEKMVFDFYSESTMSCHMVIDGKGGFKTDRKWIETILSNSEKLLNGEEIASEF
ncbi:MAG: DUF4340 domain-containing protein [Clostridia bacterium]|nr:DUF4340 domain-containing protein [Clostridia bacterium]